MKDQGRMSILKATQSYEKWLGQQVQIVPEDLGRKHEAMRKSPFLFLRATYYRWAQLWPKVRKPVRVAKEVLAVGDLHVENFGTWRDAEGRLVWGVNDFDEAFRLPYTQDLLRLAVSARLAIAGGGLVLEPQAADNAILDGYKDGLEAGGRPFVLGERWRALWRLAMDRIERPDKLWNKLESLPPIAAKNVPDGALKALSGLLPGKNLPMRYAHRVAGTGSLGRQRFVAYGEWCGGTIAREAKAMAPPAFAWSGRAEGSRDLYREILTKAVRCQDPFLAVRKRWVVRRLAPDCSRIELSDLSHEKEAAGLLHAMGWETANVHLGSAAAASLLVDLVSRPTGWLHEAVDEMVSEVEGDWEAWKNKEEPDLAPPQKASKK